MKLDSPRLKYPRKFSVPAILMIGLLPLTHFAQTSTEPEYDDADVVELSVFQVSSSRDTGYAATDTLAGSRVRTELRNLASSVTVVTDALMQDVGATNLQEVVGYLANVENHDDSADAASATADADLIAPNRTRIRGLDGTSTTRNYFPTNIRLDSYNTNRLDVSRGPNSIMFGLGSPAGIINSTLQKAEFRNQYQVQAEYDSEGSHRAVIKVNQELIEGRLAVRFNGLHEEEEFWQKPSFDHQNRGYFAVQAKPFDNTLINASYEKYWNKRQRARSTLIRDGVTPWIEAGRPTWAPGDPVNSAYFATNSAAFSPVYVNGGSLGPVDQFFSRAREVHTKGPEEFFTGSDRFYYSLSTDIFPASINFNGMGSTAELEGDVMNISLEQKIGQNLFLELAYNEEESDTHLIDLLGYGHPSSQLLADPNEFLPSGAPNPNVGRYYIDTNPRAILRNSASESMRATASYKLDFSESSADWLGTHHISALGSKDTVEAYNNTARELISSTHDWMPNAAKNNLRNNGRRLQRRFYFDDPFNPQGGTSYADPDYVVLNGEVDGVMSDPSMLGAIANRSSRTETESVVGALQSYLWDNKIVTTVGLRRDSQSVFQGAPLRSADNLWMAAEDLDIPDTANLSESQNTSTYGVAFHPTSWMSVYYNQADNFSLGGAVIDVYSRPLPGATGEGEDIGFAFRTSDNRYSVRVTHFEVTQAGATANTFRNYFRSNIDNIEEAVAVYSNQARDPDDGAANLFPVYDQSAKGFELEAIANPTSNWRVMVNLSKQETIQTNIAPYVREFVESRVVAWTPFFNETLIGSSQTIGNAYNSSIKYGLDLSAASEGFRSPRQSEWRFNVVNNYTFDADSVLKGWSVGSALQWAEAPVIGYPNQALGSGDIVPDVSRPYFGDDKFNIDAWLRYRFTIAESKRVVQLQLNIKNLLGEDDLIAQRARSDGFIGNYQAPARRRLVFSATMTF